MTSIAASASSQVSNDAYTRMAATSDVVPNSVLDVPPVSQANGSSLVVDDVLEGVSVYNKTLWMQQHTDWDYVASRLGQSVADKAKADDATMMASFAQGLMHEAGVAGVPVSTTSVASDSNTASALTVGSENFTSGASSYSVTTDKDGSMAATKDGKAWKSWEPTATSASLTSRGFNSAAEIAVQLLNRKGKILSSNV